MELVRVPLWRGEHVPVCQLVADFARYLYLPRLNDASVLLEALREGCSTVQPQAVRRRASCIGHTRTCCNRSWNLKVLRN
jgi:hypothetical protein